MNSRRAWVAAAAVLLLIALLMWLCADDIDGDGLVAFPWHAL